MKAPVDHIGIAVVKITRLMQKDGSDRDFRKETKIILQELVNQKREDMRAYTKRLEEEVKDFRTIKKLLK